MKERQDGENEKKPFEMGRTMALLLMILLVFSWGFEYIAAKKSLELVTPMTLLFLKYFVGLVVIVAIKLVIDRNFRIAKRDIPVLLLCAIFGEILYYYCEYTALFYIPVSLVTVVLAFVPGLSIIVERVVFKQRVTKVMVASVIACILSVMLVIGVDLDVLFQGRIFGYLLAFGAVFAWNAYNFLTVALQETYNSITVSYAQLLGTLLLIAPYALSHLPPKEAWTGEVVGGILYLGIFSSGIGLLILVKALKVLGPTVNGMFSNLLPITSTFFGWLLLNETIAPLQMVGGVVIIAAACLILREKAKLEAAAEDCEG